MMKTTAAMQAPLLLETQYRDYVWGGDRLRPGHAPTAEAWAIYEKNRICTGPLSGAALAEAAAQYGADLLGRRAVAVTGLRFPLLVKLIDSAAWLSLQVHPNDEQATRLEGPEFFGKMEAWHVIDSTDGAEVLCGLRPGVARDELDGRIRHGGLLEIMQRISLQTGDTLLIRPGMIHAVGPGLMLYEVQQTSDLTYRVYDWDRPMTQGRELHIEKTLAVADPTVTPILTQPPAGLEDGARRLVSCPYFSLDWLEARQQPLELDPAGESFHALTVLSGGGRLCLGEHVLDLQPLQSLLVPAAAGAYRVEPGGEGIRLLKAEAGAG